MNKIILPIILMAVLYSGCSHESAYPEACITIKVINEDGKPLEGINVSATFEVSNGITPGIKYNTIKATTDNNGVYTVSGNTMFNVAYGAYKQGYYKSYGEFPLISNNNGRWQPWNPEVTVVLRKIEHPVPMYARNAYVSPITVPALRKAVGFDLIEYEWVSPYGKGKHTDFLFRLNSTYNPNPQNLWIETG